MNTILAADIGGTNSRFSYFQVDGEGTLRLVETRWLKTSDAASFGNLLKNLRTSGFALAPEAADITVVAVAGPVERGVYSAPPFIDWQLDFSSAEEDYGLKRPVLVNDFVAQAFACRSPIGEAAEAVLSGTVDPGGTVAVIGAGTALGKAALVPDGVGGFVAMASEGGHANFPFVSDRECEYERFLLGELGDEYPTYNAVVSGRGLSLLHRFLTGENLKPDGVASAFRPESDTLRWAARFYGRAARNYALETLATGGVYIAGGVAARNPEIVRHDAFREEFRNSPKHSRLLASIPVFLISDEQSGLWGAARLGQMKLKRGA